MTVTLPTQNVKESASGMTASDQSIREVHVPLEKVPTLIDFEEDPIANEHSRNGVIEYNSLHIRLKQCDQIRFRKTFITQFYRRLASVDSLEGRCPKEGCHFVEVALCPFGEGMVVALSTGNIGSEKSGQRIGEAIQRHTRIAQEVCCGTVLSEPAFGREHIVNQFVPRTIFLKLFL